MKIGFLGVGTVSTAVIEAMASRGGVQETIYLSPRGEKRSTDLAARRIKPSVDATANSGS